MAKSVEAIINHQLLTWARESAGYTVEALAKKAKVKFEDLEDFERGTRRPSITQLRRLAEACKRHIACFYLPDAPKGDFQPLKDFRRQHGALEFHDSIKLGFEIRDAESRRETALELMRDIGEKPTAFAATANLSENAEAVGQRIRKLLGIDWESQVGWADPNEALNRWRAAVERSGVLVFQMSTVRASEVRALSIARNPLPIVLLNTKDHEHPRMFSLMHECAHLMLRTGGICDIREDAPRGRDEQEVEVFCNAVAGAALVPGAEFQEAREEYLRTHVGATVDDIARTFSYRLKVSREVVLRRSLNFGFISEVIYRAKRDQYQKEFAELARKKKEKGGGFVSPPRKVISNLGLPYTRVVLNGYGLEKITSSDLSDFLGIKLRHLAKVHTELTAKSVKYWTRR